MIKASRWRRRDRTKNILCAMWMIFILALILIPVYWIATASLKQPEDLISRTPKFWGFTPTLKSYVNLFKDPFLKFDRLTANSLFVGLSCTLLSILVAIPAALSLTRLRFKGKKALGSVVFFVYLVPSTLLLLPLYSMMASVNLQDTRMGLVLVYASFNVPFCIWMLRGFFMSIPVDLEESAMIDGCSRFGAWMRVVLPLAGPGLGAAAIFSFTLSWNEFLYAYVLTETAQASTMPVGLAGFIMLDTYHWAELSAGAMVMALPAVVIYFLCQRFIVAGLTGGAVKG